MVWIQDIRVNWVKYKCIPHFADFFFLQNKKVLLCIDPLDQIKIEIALQIVEERD